MKKLIALVLATLLVAALFVGCAAPTYKYGLGVVTSIGRSADVSEKDGAAVDGKAESDSVICAVVLDSKNKVVNVRFDMAQTPITFDATGKITADKSAEIKTKRELGDAYGMIKASKIGKEWYQQIDALEAWMTGKTVDQVAGMKLKDSEEGKVVDEADLVSGVSLGISDFLAAFNKAVANAK